MASSMPSFNLNYHITGLIVVHSHMNSENSINEYRDRGINSKTDDIKFPTVSES